jgi:predicted peptidase
VLILHGAGGRGSDNIQNLRNWNEWMAAEDLRRKHPAFVLAPQTSTPWSDPTSPFAKAPTIDDVFTAHVFERLKEIGGNLKFTTLRGVKHGANTPAFHYNGDDPAKGFFTAYASDRPDKTEDIWDWLFNQAR